MRLLHEHIKLSQLAPCPNIKVIIRNDAGFISFIFLSFHYIMHDYIWNSLYHIMKFWNNKLANQTPNDVFAQLLILHSLWQWSLFVVITFSFVLLDSESNLIRF